MALSVPLSRFTSRVGGGSAFFVRHFRRFDDFADVLRFTVHVFAPPVATASIALAARRHFARLIPVWVFLVAVVSAFAATGVAFCPLAVVAASGTGYRAVRPSNARA